MNSVSASLLTTLHPRECKYWSIWWMFFTCRSVNGVSRRPLTSQPVSIPNFMGIKRWPRSEKMQSFPFQARSVPWAPRRGVHDMYDRRQPNWLRSIVCHDAFRHRNWRRRKLPPLRGPPGPLNCPGGPVHRGRQTEGALASRRDMSHGCPKRGFTSLMQRSPLAAFHRTSRSFPS